MTIEPQSQQMKEAMEPPMEAQRLQREHNELKNRLGELHGRPHLSPQEEIEYKTLQKLKLAKKDRIASILVDYYGRT